MGYYVQAYLNKMRDVTYETREIDDGFEECIVIPMRRNGIRHTSKGSTILPIALNEKRPNAYKQTHYASIIMDKELRQEVEELGYGDRFKYFGYAKLVYDPHHNSFAGQSNISLDDAMEID